MNNLNSIKGMFDLNRTELMVMLISELDFSNIKHEHIVSKTANYHAVEPSPMMRAKFSEWAKVNCMLYTCKGDDIEFCEIKSVHEINFYDTHSYGINTISELMNNGDLDPDQLRDLADIASAYFEQDSAQAWNDFKKGLIDQLWIYEA